MRGFVAYLWHLETEEVLHQRERVLPSACGELVLDLSPSRDAVSAAVLSGIFSRAATVGIPRRTTLMGVHFEPGGLRGWSPLPASSLHDRRLPLQELWGRETERLREELAAAPQLRQRFLLLERFLVRRLDPVPLHPAVGYALGRLQPGAGETSVAELTRRTGYSHRYLLARFREQVGLSPKAFQRLQRFRRTVMALERRSSVPWAEVAAQNGYFDQSHLVREFRLIAGTTPSGWLARRASHPLHLVLPD